MDPACGSGIFLRTLLEFQCDPSNDSLSPDLVDAAFQGAVGLDRDPNAVAAAQLSLSLLHLVLTGRLPEKLSVVSEGLLRTFTFRYRLRDDTPLDAILMNPPFVSTTDAARRRNPYAAVRLFGEQGKGRVDLYLAFVKDAVERLPPGGFGLFVLPHSFLLSKSAQKLRDWILEQCLVQCLADLSAIRVFEDTNIYIILLIVQRKSDTHSATKATIIKCQDQVGLALQDAIEGKRVEGKLYSIYEVEQSAFESSAWSVLAPAESAMESRMRKLPVLDEFLELKQGVVTGADEIFIVENRALPRDEKSLFIPLLHDREMEAYSVPRRTSHSVFFPYLDGVKVKEKDLRSHFPETWRYLTAHRQRLAKRSSLPRYRKEWWEPMWPREPKTLLRPKLVTPT